MLVYIFVVFLLAESTYCAQDPYDAALYSWSRTLAESFQVVKTKYYSKDLNPKDAFLKAIGSFVNLDPHSSLLSPPEYEEILGTTKGEFFGVGVAITEKNPDDEFLVIINTIPDGPAEKAGIKAGDKLIEIDGVSLRGLSTSEATAKLKGPRHSTVNVKVMREKQEEPLSFAIKRDVVKEQSTLSYYFPTHGIYYVHLNTFSNNAVTALEQLIKRAYKQKCKGLILDLRNNSGGLLTSAVEMAGLFLDKGSLVASTKDRDNKQIEEYRTARDPLPVTCMPLVVLINNFSASAAEILAGCLKVHSQEQAKKSGKQKIPVLLLGTKSFGKGSVQEVIPVSNECAIKLTTALYFLPNGETIQGVGIEPDITFERKFPPSSQMLWVSQTYGRESALRNSIKPKGAKEEKKQTPDKKKELDIKLKRKEAVESDTQIRDAVTCLNILNNNPNAWNNRTEAITLLKKVLALDDNMKSEEVT